MADGRVSEVVGAGYDPNQVLRAIDEHTVPVAVFMTVCLVATFTYLVLAFRTASRHRAYPAPLAVGWGLFNVWLMRRYPAYLSAQSGTSGPAARSTVS